MSTNVIQKSFAAGELAPSMLARTDLAKFHTGAATLRNFFVDYRSGASTRVGTKFIMQALDSTQAVRLIPFQYSVTATYILEFGDQYIRFISEGATVVETSFAITGATAALPCVLTVVGNPWVNDDWIFVTGIVGMTRLNNRFYKVQVAGNTVTLFDVNNRPIDARTFTAYTSGGTGARVYKISSPYQAEDLALLKFIQSAQVMTLTHPSYATYELTLTAATSWTLTAVSTGVNVNPPTSVTPTASAAGTVNYAYVVTSVDANGNESAVSASGATTSVNIGTTAGSIRVTFTAPAAGNTPDYYNVYKAEPTYSGVVPVGASYGFVGFCTATTFDDTNIVPDFSQQPPIVNTPFSAGNNPGCASYFSQRLVYAGSNANPLTLYASQPGLYANFNTSFPSQEDDALTETLVSAQVNAVKWMISMQSGLVVGTAKGAWLVNGGSAGAAFTVSTATAVPQAYNGASDVQPIVVNNDILYVQAKGAIVRDLSFNIYANIYTGTDISVLSNHLFFQYQITEWAYSEEPFKLIWAIRDDGTLLSLTYVKEQELYGWGRHDTKGLFQSVASITEGQVDAVYVVVQRYLTGLWIKCIERMADRAFPYGAEDAWSVDCGLSSTLPTPAANIVASAITGSVTFTADASVFVSGDVGSVLRMGGGIATITGYTSATIVSGTFTKDMTSVLPDDDDEMPLPVLSGNWSLTAPSTTFIGFDHLEGSAVSVLADGGTVYTTITNGTLTLPYAATKVVGGLGFQAQLQTMYLDVPGEATIQGKRKKISALSVRCMESRGLKAGRTFERLVSIKELNRSVAMGNPIPLVTGDERVIMDQLWDTPGQICLQQNDPLPVTVLGVIPEIEVGDT